MGLCDRNTTEYLWGPSGHTQAWPCIRVVRPGPPKPCTNDVAALAGPRIFDSGSHDSPAQMHGCNRVQLGRGREYSIVRRSHIQGRLLARRKRMHELCHAFVQDYPATLNMRSEHDRIFSGPPKPCTNATVHGAGLSGGLEYSIGARSNMSTIEYFRAREEPCTNATVHLCRRAIWRP